MFVNVADFCVTYLPILQYSQTGWMTYYIDIPAHRDTKKCIVIRRFQYPPSNRIMVNVEATENLNQASTFIVILFDGRKITTTKNPTVFHISDVTDKMYLHSTPYRKVYGVQCTAVVGHVATTKLLLDPGRVKLLKTDYILVSSP